MLRIYGWVRGHRSKLLRRELVAGLSLAACVIPEKVSHAHLVGLWPRVGLYSSVAAALVYAVFGRSRSLIAGTNPSLAVLMAGDIGSVAVRDPALAAAMAALTALIAGLIAVAAWALRLGLLSADDAALMRAEAEHVAELSRAAIAARGRFVLALAGGSTPRRLYELLARPPFLDGIDWSLVHVFWGDERYVPPDHPQSNYRMACEALLDRVAIPDENLHRIHGEDEPHRAAEAYEQALRGFLGPAEGPPDRSFDQVLLGMGNDGHTASLFPGTPPLTEGRRWVMAQYFEPLSVKWRITLTPVVLNAAADVTFLVAGASKAQRLREVLEGGRREMALPAQLIRPKHGVLHWRVDAVAGASLHRTPGGTP